MDVAQGSDFGPPSARRELAIVECKDEPLDLMPSRRDATTFSDGRKSALPEDSDRARIDLRQIAPCELADVADDLPGDGDGSDLDGRINQLPTPVRTESLVILRGARAAGFAVGEEFIHI